VQIIKRDNRGIITVALYLMYLQPNFYSSTFCLHVLNTESQVTPGFVLCVNIVTVTPKLKIAYGTFFIHHLEVSSGDEFMRQ
jgi:hypothetical protein